MQLKNEKALSYGSNDDGSFQVQRYTFDESGTEWIASGEILTWDEAGLTKCLSGDEC